MTEDRILALPREVGENLILRWARPDDADELADFNVRLHSDDPARPEAWLGDWTRDFLNGAHPTTGPEQVTVVEDMQTGRIVSSQLLIPQTWTYDGIPFGVGRPELVATEEAYRRRGLIRHQMELAHLLSERMGHMVQAITGIPWYYRMFGYEMALNLGGSRLYFWDRPGNDKAVDQEVYSLRPAAVDDIELLQELYHQHCAQSLVVHERTADIWRFQLQGAHRDSMAAMDAYIVSDGNGRPAAYVEFRPYGTAISVRELGVAAGHSWRSIALFIVRELKRRAAKLNEGRDRPLTCINFHLSETHPVYHALGRQLEKARDPYAWYVRVADIHAFVRHIRPSLEARLGESVLAGHSGRLRLNFYKDTLTLRVESGKIVDVGRYRPQNVEDADAMFPNLTFLQLLFGHRSLSDLARSYADCYAQNAEAEILLNVLFPRRPSAIRPLD